MTLSNTSGLYAITDCENITTDDLLVKTTQILETGIALLQYRNKTKDKQQKKILAKKLQSLCTRYDTPFIVNDDIALAKEINADGVHLGKDDIDINIARQQLGNKIIGISCYNDYDRAFTAKQNGADYIAFGAFFPSPTKPNAVKAEINLITKAKKELSIPVVAIGGITPENGEALVNAGVNFLAVISRLYLTSNTTEAAVAYNNLFLQNNHD